MMFNEGDTIVGELGTLEVLSVGKKCYFVRFLKVYEEDRFEVGDEDMFSKTYAEKRYSLKKEASK